MADEEDLAALRRGELDLVARDFRNADLSNQDLSKRDLRKALLQSAILNATNFSDSDLSGCNLFMVHAQGASFRRVKAHGTVFQNSNFSQADFSGSSLGSSVFQACDFSNSILNGADFSECGFGEESNFSKAIVNETTRFDNATMHRSLARQEAFRYYHVERGRLVRNENSPVEQATELSYKDILVLIERTQSSLRDAANAKLPESRVIGIGHNGPPVESPLSINDVEEVRNALFSLSTSLSQTSPDYKKMETSNLRLSIYAARIGEWVLAKVNIFADEFAKSLGQQAATVKLWIALWLLFTGQLTHLLTEVSAILR